MTQKFFLSLLRLLPFKTHIKDLEKIDVETVLSINQMQVLPAFQKIAKTLPFYKKLLSDKGVVAKSIKTLEDFRSRVPVLTKEDVFETFSARELCQGGNISDVTSAIVTSGTSGRFAYGLLTNADSVLQKKMVDEMLDYEFDAKKVRPLVINALSMGVTFSSSYPVITTSVRSDIVLHLVKTLSPFYKQIIIITMSPFAKKIAEEASALGVDWGKVKISFVVGGTSTSNSLFQYIKSTINPAGGEYENKIFGTMGMTELGLNLFFTPTYLLEIREKMQSDPTLRKEILGYETRVCPEIMHYVPSNFYFEILDTDEKGFGKLVISNLDTTSKTPLIRYDTGDVAKFLDRENILRALSVRGVSVPLSLHLPIMAVAGRRGDVENEFGFSTKAIDEALYQDSRVAGKVTGHYKILKEGGETVVCVQLKKDASLDEDLEKILRDKICNLTEKEVRVVLKKYLDFGYDMELNYENKWKHI